MLDNVAISVFGECLTYPA